MRNRETAPDADGVHSAVAVAGDHSEPAVNDLRTAARILGLKLDLNRLTGLVSLGPTRCYLGTEMLSWYVLFEFDAFDAAVLECPYEGNAAYVIHGEWRTVVGLTKQEIREKYPNRCSWIVHKNNWLNRIREALQREPTR